MRLAKPQLEAAGISPLQKVERARPLLVHPAALASYGDRETQGVDAWLPNLGTSI